VAFCLVAAAIAALVGGADATRPHHGVERQVAAAPEQVPVESASLVCPRTSGSSGGSNRLALVAPAHVGTGVAQLRSRDPRTPLPRLALDAAGTASVVDSRLVAAEPVVTATGTLASGIVADTVLRVDDGPSRGILGGRCVAPATEFWFLGAATSVGRQSSLTLTNVDPLPAVVDVSFTAPKGPVNAPTSRGITIGPGQARTIHLETVAPGEGYLLVHISARAGRVGAFLLQHVLYANAPGGADFIPPVISPELVSVVPGLPNGIGFRRVVIGNPGADDATVKLTLVTSDGSFVPAGLESVSMAGHSTKMIDVTEPLAQQSGAVRVESDQPVVVSAVADTGPRLRNFGEFAWSAAVPPLEGPTPVGVTTIARGRSTIFLSAPSAGGTVLVTTLGVGGAVISPPRRIGVGAGRTVAVDLPPQTSAAFSVVLELVQGAGPVYAARELLELGARGPLYTIEPVVSGRGLAVLRPVVADLRVSQLD
jgi:hypothetical protein